MIHINRDPLAPENWQALKEAERDLLEAKELLMVCEPDRTPLSYEDHKVLLEKCQEHLDHI